MQTVAACLHVAFWGPNWSTLSISHAHHLLQYAEECEACPEQHCLAQVAFWASLYLLRRMKWAVLGRPQPPIVHASPTVAELQACATAEEAAELSLEKGYSAGGTAPLP